MENKYRRIFKKRITTDNIVDAEWYGYNGRRYLVTYADGSQDWIGEEKFEDEYELLGNGKVREGKDICIGENLIFYVRWSDKSPNLIVQHNSGYEEEMTPRSFLESYI